MYKFVIFAKNGLKLVESINNRFIQKQNLLKLKFKILLPVLLCVTFFCSAQDLHFTQHYNIPMSVSPALTGIFRGDQRFIGAGRGQWYTADAPYTTFHGSFDQKVYSQKLGKGFLGVGGALGYDRSGDSRLALIQLNLSGSYSYVLDEENILTGGLMLGAGQRSFDMADLRWGSQHDGELYSANNPSGENFNESGYIYPDFGIGVNYRAQKTDKRTHIDIGVAAFHLHQPNQSFADQGVSKLQPKYSIYANQLYQIKPKFDFYLNGLAQLQDKYFEGVVGAGGRWHLNQRRGKELALQGGLAYRLNEIGDAAILAAEAHYQNWRLGVSYDINVSEYRIASNRNGGPEATLTYIVAFVKPIPVFKICPII